MAGETVGPAHRCGTFKLCGSYGWQPVGSTCRVNSDASFIDQQAECVGNVVQRPAFQFGASTPSCATAAAGMVQWTGSALQFCDGSSWNTFASSSNTITLGTQASTTNAQRSGDATTGLFTPAANTVAVATTGTERVRIDSSGNAGIGTSSPSAQLTVQASSGNPAGIVGLNHHYAYGSTGSGYIITTAAVSGNTANEIQAFPTGDTVGGSLALNPAGGNVGLGTTSPGTSLDVNGGVTMEPTSVTLTANNTVLSTANSS